MAAIFVGAIFALIFGGAIILQIIVLLIQALVVVFTFIAGIVCYIAILVTNPRQALAMWKRPVPKTP